MKKSLFLIAVVLFGIIQAHALDYISIQGYNNDVESICMEMTDTITVSVDPTWESGLDSHSWILAGDVSFANGYDANSNPCKVVVPPDGYGKGRVTYKFKEGRCSSMEYFDVFKSFVCPQGLEIKGPECIIDSQEVVYSVDPMLTKNLGAQIGIDSYKWNVLESNQPFVHEILYVSSDSSSITFKVGQVDPQDPPVITVSVGQCNDWELSKTLGNATPKPELQDTMYLPVGFGDVKIGVVNPKPNMEYTWACPSFAIEPYGANGDSAVIHITGQDADKMEFEVYVNATYTDITCNTSADTMKIVRTWGHTGIFDKNNITDSCYTPNNTYTFAVEGELPINTKCDWRLPEGWNFHDGKVSDLKTITIVPSSSANLKDTLFVKPLDPHDTATPDTFIVHVRPDTIPVARIKQDSCLAYNYEGGVYIDTTGLHLPEGVEFEWNVPDSIKGVSGGTDTLHFTPNYGTTSVQVRAKGKGGCDGVYSSYSVLYKPDKPDSIRWIDSACISFNMLDTLRFSIANPIPNQKYAWTKPEGWKWGDTISTPKDLAVTIELISNGIAGNYIISAKGINDGNICKESVATEREVTISAVDDYIVVEPGSWGMCKLSTRYYSSSTVNWYLLYNGEKVSDFSVYNFPTILDGVVSSTNIPCNIEGTNYTLVADIEYSDGCHARLQYGAPTIVPISYIAQKGLAPGNSLSPKEHKLFLSPNPTRHELIVDIKDAVNRIAELYIIDIQGKVVVSSKTFELGTSYDVSSIPVGQYLVCIRQEKKHYANIFIKQ